ncbi:MAG: aquaporin-like protein [Linnemannia gamsii]|nr:MAG: aquaporin-like protein [Linnemannia gamsii]
MAQNHTKFAEGLMESGQLSHFDTRDGPSFDTQEDTSRWAFIRDKLRKAAAEFVGTVILTTFGFGAIAQLVLTRSSTWGAMCATWGLSLTLAIYASGGISGAALNPAVTLALAIFRGFSWYDVPVYWAAQSAGAFVGALIIYLLNEPAIRLQTIADPNHTIGIFVTGLQTESTSTAVGFFAEFLGTALLVFVILATSEGRGITPTDPKFQPVVIGLTLTAIGMGLGAQTGFALNPARDFAPRVFVAVIGWGTSAFSRQGYYFWVPIIAPFLGAIGGALSKVFFCRMNGFVG